MEEVERPYTMAPLGARGASLEDSYRHVLNLQSKQQATSKPHKGRVHPTSVPTNDEYAATMYHLSQLEPVYHDLENDKSSSSSGNTRTTRSSTTRDNDYKPVQMPATDLSNGNASLRSCWPAGSTNLVNNNSQLEGLTGNGKSKAPTKSSKSYRVFPSSRKPLMLKDAPKKSVEDATPILMGSDAFETSSVVTGMSQQEVLRRKARAVNQKKKKNVAQQRSSKKPKKADRILNLPLSLLGGGKKPPANKHFAEIKITKKPIESEETARSLKVSATNGSSPQPYSIDPKVDSRFSGDDSFPILSKHTTLSIAEEEPEDAANDSRIVRFSKDESHTHVFNDSSDRPFDEDEVTTPVDYSTCPPLAPPEGDIAPSPPSSNRSFQSLNSSSSGGLKSILRPARFSPAKQYPDATNDGGDEIGNVSISKSPPRGSPGFIDDGVELSPIVRANRVPADGGTNGVTFRESIQDVGSLYPDPSMEAPTEYSDPTIDASGDCNTDEDSMMSTVGFIQNVASIVIQTAFRRHRARQFVKILRDSEAVSSSDVLDQLFPSPQRQEPSLDHSLEVRRCFGLPEANPSAYSEPISDTLPLKAYPPPSRKSRKAKKIDPFEERLFALAAVQIQSLFRGFWVRDCLNVDHYCAAVIQRAFRSHCCRMEYNFQIYRIVIVQSIWRRQLARREASFRLGCVLLIQSAARLFLRRLERAKPFGRGGARTERRLKAAKNPASVRGVSRRPGSKMDEAAILIQKNWRTFYYETNYLKTLLDVLLVQTAVRRWFAVRKVNRMKTAQQRLKRRHRYVAAASRRRAASRVAPSSSVSMASARVAITPQPAVVTPRGFKVASTANNSGGSVTGSTSDVSDDGRTPQFRMNEQGKHGSRASMELKAVNCRPPLPSSASKVAVVTPKPWPPKSSSRYPDDYGGSSTGSTSALTDDEIQVETTTSPPASAPILIEEDSPGGAKAILSLWRERDRKNSAGKR